MILLSSNAQHIFWLGRYLTRIQYTCSLFPFTEDESARHYAHAFCLPAFDACSLNELILDPEQPFSFHQQFQNAKNNIHDLRGVLSAHCFAELNQLLRQAENHAGYICDVAAECNDVLEAEADEDIFMFFCLGQKVEQLDRHIRLQQNRQAVLTELDVLIEKFRVLGWTSLAAAWQQLKKMPDCNHFYHFSDHIQNLFEMDAA